MVSTRRSKARPGSHPAAAAAPTHSHLEALPVELLEWVAQYQDSKDFFNLRLTSKEISWKLVNHMARTYFREFHALLMEPESMNTLNYICKHPVYQKSLRTIKLNTATFANEDKYEHKYSLRVSASAMSHDTRKRRGRHCVQIKYREFALDMLKLILLQLRLSGNVPGIETVAGSLNPINGPWGFNRLEKEHGEDILAYDHHRAQEHFTLVIQALYETEYPIRSLKLGSHFNARLEPWTITEVAYEAPMPTPSKHLRSLHLSLAQCVYRPIRAEILGEDFERDHVECQRIQLLRTISEAKHLEVLHLDVLNSYSVAYRFESNGALFETLAKDVFAGHEKPLQHIRELKLSGQNISQQTLIDFVYNHRATLQKLELWEISEVLYDVAGEEFGLRHVDIDGFKRQLFIVHADKERLQTLQLKVGRTYEGMQKELYPGDAGWKLPVWET